MIVPSIDLMGGNAVQLVGGKEKALDAGDPRPLAEKFGLVGELAVIDLDAAMSQGSNESVIEDLIKIAPCRVGGGIRDVETAIKWLDKGAASVILGTKAVPEILSQLPKERVIAALDADHGEVVVEGWKTGTGRSIVERMHELSEYVGGFLVTFVEKEGRLGGTNLDQVAELIKASGGAKLTIAGGVTTSSDIAQLDTLGADAQVGMALYTGKLSLTEAFAAPLRSDREDGLWPTVVSNEFGETLGLCYSNQESLDAAVSRKKGIYHSRSRGLWVKGESSGATQELLSVKADCDRDAILFRVRQNAPGFCHLETKTCFGSGEELSDLFKLIEARKDSAPDGSYTKRLFEDEDLLSSKILEEAKELTEATSKDELAWEAADVIYFTLVKLAKAGVNLEDVRNELARRSKKVTRRPGNKKPASS